MPQRCLFSALIKIRGINPYVEVRAHHAQLLRKDWRRPMPVLVRLNGRPSAKAWQINLMPMGNGHFYLYLHNSLRQACGAQTGDRVSVELQFNHAYKNGPLHPMPRWFRDALAESPQAAKNWSRLPASRKKEVLRYFAQLKTEAAKLRNLNRAIAVLSGKPARFMARNWVDGR